jgi:hypothetical protein
MKLVRGRLVARSAIQLLARVDDKPFVHAARHSVHERGGFLLGLIPGGNLTREVVR